MTRKIDFNKFEQPTIAVTFRDEAQTTIHVTAPSVELVEKLDTNRDEITARLKANTGWKSLQPLYEFAAELMSENEEWLEITAEDLKRKYKFTYIMLFTFFVEYMGFINDIKSAKN